MERVPLLSAIYGWSASNAWRDSLGSNMLDSGALRYDTYLCQDGKYVALGAIERPAFEQPCVNLEVDAERFPDQLERS